MVMSVLTVVDHNVKLHKAVQLWIITAKEKILVTFTVISCCTAMNVHVTAVIWSKWANRAKHSFNKLKQWLICVHTVAIVIAVPLQWSPWMTDRMCVTCDWPPSSKSETPRRCQDRSILRSVRKIPDLLH